MLINCIKTIRIIKKANHDCLHMKRWCPPYFLFILSLEKLYVKYIINIKKKFIVFL